MSMSGRKSILVKLVLIMLLISIVSGGIVLGVALNEQRQSLENNLIEENKRLAQVAARSIETGYVKQSWPFRTLSQINDSEDVLFWWIVDPEGAIHLTDEPAMCGKIVDIKSFGKEEEAAAVVKDYVYRGEDIKFLVQPLRIGEPGKVWYLCIGISLKSVIAATNRVIITSLCYFSLIIAFACGLAFLFARRFTKPIRNLVEGTKAIARGDFDAKVEVKTGDEIEGLGDAFNKMAEQIKNSFALEKAAREELQKSEEKYRSLVESTEDIVYLVTKDCRFIFVNDKYLTRFRGLPIHRVIDRAYGEFHSSEETKEFAEIVNQVFETGKSIQSEHRSRRDGRYFLRTLSPVKDSEGRTTAVTVVSKDFTERKRAEEEVKKSRKFLDTIIENIPDPLYIKDRQFRFVEVNKAFYHTHKVTKGKILWEPRYRETDKEIFKTGKELEIPEQHYTDAEGNQHWTHLKKVPLTDESGNITHVLTISRDITERKRADDALRESHEKLEELDKMKTDFLTVAYHEMRTPLAPIVGYTSLLEQSELSEKQKKYVRIIEESVTQLEELIDSLLEVTRIEAGRVKLSLEKVSIPEIVKSVLERFKPQADAKKQTISTVVPEGIEVEGDKQKITAIFDNLSSNAIKYTGEKGRINIVVEDRKEEEDIRVCVADTGIGIPEEQLPRVFERFYMVDTSLTRKGGLGLGLAIVKGYVELHGGKVWATSELGKGSKFWFTVPKKQMQKQK